MSGQFKVGDVCIWQNCRGPWARLNGTETTITAVDQVGLDYFSGRSFIGFLTDTIDPFTMDDVVVAEPHELRKKDGATSGEDMIRSMFDTPSVERRQPVTAWQAQYDTAQALMKMGVRVKPGQWPVEVV